MAIEKVINVKVNDKGVDKLNKSLQTTSQEADKSQKGLSGITQVLDTMTGGAITKLKGFSNGLKGVSIGFKSIGVAIAASGIGLLVITIAALAAAFKSSEEGQNKFAKLTGVIGAVVGNLVDLLANLGEALISAIENPKQAWDSFVNALKSGYELIKDQVITRFQSNWTILTGAIERGALKMRIAWNEFTGDAEEAEALKIELKEVEDQMIAAAAEINRVNNVIVEGFNNAVSAVGDFIDEQKAEMKLASQIADMRAKATKLDRELLIQTAKTENEIAELRLKARQEDEFSSKQRANFLKDAQKLEDENLQKQTESLKLKAEAIRLENTLSKSTTEALDAEAEAQAAVIRQEAARTNAAKATQRELNRINKEISAQAKQRRKEDEEADKKRIKDEEDRLNAIEKIRLDFLKKEEDLNAKTEEAKLELERKRAQESLDALTATESEKQEAQLQLNAFFDQKEIDLEKAKQDKLLQVRKEAEDARTKLEEQQAEERRQLEEAVQQAKVSSVLNGLQLVRQIVGEDSKLGKGLAAAQTVIQGIQGVQSAYTTAQKSPITTLFPAYPLVQAGLAGAFSALQVKKILSTDPTGKTTPNLGGGGGGGGAAASPSFNVVGTSGVNQIAQQLGQEQQPVQAFVVGSNVTTQQELDRNIVNTASIG